MKKNLSRLLSLVLVLVMVLTAIPASAVNMIRDGEGDWWNWWVQPAPIGNITHPEQTLTAELEDGTTVTVIAREGVLPAKTRMTAQAITNIEAVQAAVDQTAGVSGTVLTAVDITFMNGNMEVQPNGSVKVQIASDALAGMDDLSVVHLDVDADELEGDEQAELIDNAQTNNEGVLFSARHFSVYAVIDPETEGDRARLTVNFWDDNGDLITYAIVTPRGIDLVDQTIPDPVVNQSQGTKQFCGWVIENPDYTSEDITGDHTINYVRDEVRARLSDTEKPVQEGDVMNVYSMYFNYFIVSFANEDGDVMVHADAVYTRDSAYNYTIPISYTPVDTSSFRFTGWDMVNDNSNKLYQSGEPASITSDTVFRARVQKGQWIEFRENPYGDNDHKGATYVPPVFCPDGTVTADLEPEDPELPGYQFKGWYEDYNNGTFSNEFDFANHPDKLTHKVILNAKWEMNPTAAVTVIIWQQNTAGTGYDFVEAVKVTANSKTTISPVTVAGSGNSTYAVIDGTDYKLEGSKVKGIYDSNGLNGQQITSVTVNPAGTSVMNVYYDRNSYTLTFQVPNPNSFEEVSSTPSYSTINKGGYYLYLGSQNYGYDYYPIVLANSDYVYALIPLDVANQFSSGSFYTKVNGTITALSHDSGGWYYTVSYTKTYVTNEDRVFFRADRSSSTHIYTTSTYITIKTIEALYGAYIGNQFPIVGTNGKTYNNGERWDPQEPSTYTEVMVYMPNMPAENVTYHLDVLDRPLKTIKWNVQTLPGETGTAASGTLYMYDPDTHANPTVTVPSGVTFKNKDTIKARYNGVTFEEDFVQFEGFTRLGADALNNYESNPDAYFYIWDTSKDGTINFYYLRNKYNIGFFDGVYLDGNEMPIEDADDRGEIRTIEDVYYEQDISSVLDYTPARTGWKFEGWYFDKGCTQPATLTTMPAHGVSVYAKWQMIQYRAILHPNGGTTSTATNFRVDYKEQVAESIPATREGYELVGWFTDPEFKHPFNFSTLLTDDTTVPYPESEKAQYGDADRDWITRKIDLYAKWRVKIPGASGITVVYNAIAYDGTDGNLVVDNAQTKTYTDPLYYLDDADAIGYSASEATDDQYYFLYWEIMTPESEGSSVLIPSGKKVYPGQEWTVDFDDAVKTVLVNSDMQPVGRGVKAGSEGMKAALEGTRAVQTYTAVSTPSANKKYLIAYVTSGNAYIMGYEYNNETYNPKAVKVSVSNNTISGDYENYLFSVELSGNYFKFKNLYRNSYLGENNSYYPYYGTSNTVWEYTNAKRLRNTTAGSYTYIGVNNNSNPVFFSTFSSSSDGNTITFFELEESSVYHTVTFQDWDGTVLSTQQVKHGTAATAPDDPIREGYTFVDWDVDFSSVTGDLIVTATYTQNTSPSGGTEVWVPVETITDTTKEYLIGIVDGGTTYLLVNKNTNASNNYWYTNYNSSTQEVWYQAYLAAAVKDGNNVIGVNGVAATDLQYCQWKFSSTSGSVISSCAEEGRYLYGATGTITNYSSNYYGYTAYDTSVDTSSSSWTYNNHRLYTGGMYVFHKTSTNSSTNITYDLLRGTTSSSSAGYVQLYMKTIVANKHTVTFYEWNNSQEYVVIGTPQSIDEGAHATAPSSANEPTGFEFNGWTMGNDTSRVYSKAEIDAMAITGDTDFYAHYTTSSGQAVYRVDFVDWDGDILKTEYVVEGGEATAPSNPTRTGYTFTGWDVDFSNVTGPLTVTASYSAVQDNKYQVTLRAVYKERVQKEYTHIYWYANNGTGAREDSGEGIQLSMNEAVDIPTPTNYVGKTETAAVVNGLSYDVDHVFLGWAKVHNTNTGANSAAYMPDHPELTVDDLFLKWEDGVFKALIPEHPKEGETQEWKVVTQVAADELTPYDDLYAVWGTVIYVYHSADNTVEKVVTTKGNGNTVDGKQFFDITKYVRDGYLYGGYYKNYAGKSTGFEAKSVAANLWTAYTPVAGRDVDTKYVYTDNGTNHKCYIEADGTINVEWNWSESYNTDTDETKTTPDADGMHMMPVPGTTYFLKEVPDTMYLQPYLHYTYKLGYGEIKSAWLFSDIDDLNYNDTGFVIVNVKKGLEQTVSVAESVTINTQNGNSSVTLTPSVVFGSKNVSSGWLTYLQVKGGTNGITLADNQVVKQYWKTPDGLYVTGTTIRSYTGLSSAMKIKKVETIVNSDITLN